MIHYCKNTVCIAIESLARHFKQLTLKNNLVLRVLRKLRQPKIFASLQRLVQNDVSQCLCVCSVLLAIGMATVAAARCRGAAWRWTAAPFASRTNFVLLLFKLEEARMRQQSRLDRRPQSSLHNLQRTHTLCSVVILREQPQFSRGCSVSCRLKFSSLSKGQLISKEFFLVFIYAKKTNKISQKFLPQPLKVVESKK